MGQVLLVLMLPKGACPRRYAAPSYLPIRANTYTRAKGYPQGMPHAHQFKRLSRVKMSKTAVQSSDLEFTTSLGRCLRLSKAPPVLSRASGNGLLQLFLSLFCCCWQARWAIPSLKASSRRQNAEILCFPILPGA